MGDFNIQLRELVKLANCPICFERMKTDVVACNNGHVVCLACKNNNLKCLMDRCPTCRAPFSTVGKTFITQLLQAIPYACENEGCGEISFDRTEIEGHEGWCARRMTKCQVPMCPWAGRLDDLPSHVRDAAHQKGNSETSADLEIRNLCDQRFTKAIYCKYYDQFFWRVQALDRESEKLILQFICVPNEKVKNNHFAVKVEFQSDAGKLLTEMKLVKNEGTMEATLTFNTGMLEHFVEEKKLKYKLSITKHDN